MHPKITPFCESPWYMLSNYFGNNQVLRGNFVEIWHIQIQIYPQTSFEPKYCAFNLKRKVSFHGVWLVAPLYGKWLNFQNSGICNPNLQIFISPNLQFSYFTYFSSSFKLWISLYNNLAIRMFDFPNILTKSILIKLSKHHIHLSLVWHQLSFPSVYIIYTQPQTLWWLD